MSTDDLFITGGGTVAVATDDQLDRVQRLEAFAETARTVVAQLVALDSNLTDSELRAAVSPASAVLAKREIAAAIPALSKVAAEAATCAHLTRLAMVRYGITEHTVEKEIDDWVGNFAKLLGRFFGVVEFAGLAAAIVLMGQISPEPSTGESASAADDPSWKKFLADHPDLLNNPVTAEAIKLIVDGLDDSLWGATELPESLILPLESNGLSGPDFASAVIVFMGYPLGKLRESKVALAAQTTVTGPGTAPTGWADRMARIPDTDHNGGYQIRIDKFVNASGKRSFEVYLSGTQTFSTSKTKTPFDFTSDANGLAGLPNGAVQSVEKAMKAAGISSSDPVNITGHSEGGLVAHEISASGHWNVQVSLEAGSPAAHTAVPTGTTEVALQHNEDIVPSLGGMRDDSDRTIVVHASAFPDGTIPPGDAVPAHDSDRYEHTAQLLDNASSSMINDAKAKADAGEKGATGTVTTTLYKAERVWK